MAVYFLRSKHLSRAKGARATRAAAYRAGERIHDERSSEVYDHTDRQDVAYKEVVLPADLADRPDMAWTQDRSVLWNAAEHAGLRCNSRVAREWLVLLPPELNAGQRTQLVRTFAKELTEKYRCAIDATVHEPRPGADSRNHHAHLLMTTREVTPDGLGHRTSLELGGRERRRLGVAGSSRDEYVAIRERWAQVTNEALKQAGLTTRIDHRSFKDQGIDREPSPNIPEKVFYAERRTHQHSAAGNAIRARHRERVEARLKGADELAQVQQKQKADLEKGALESTRSRDGPKQLRWGALTREQRNEKRRERYRARKAQELANRGVSKSTSSPTAEESAERWKAYRESHGPGTTAEESARNWLEWRERQGSPGPTQSITPTREETRESRSVDEDDLDRKPRRHHERDFDL